MNRCGDILLDVLEAERKGCIVRRLSINSLKLCLKEFSSHIRGIS
jgi:hypothetical protein